MMSQSLDSGQQAVFVAGGEVCPVCGSNAPNLVLEAPDRFHMRKQLYEIMECRACSFGWLSNPPNPQEMLHHYGSDYHRLITASGEAKLLKRWQEPRDRVFSMSKGGVLLDIGCSSGGFLRTLKGGPWKLYGIEISPSEARRAEETSGAEVFVGTVLDAPFDTDSFDVITCLHVLEHVYQLSDVVRTLRAWLKPGGIIYLQVPNFQGLEASIFKSYWYGLELPRHLYHFSPKSLRELFVSHDFEVELLRTLSNCYVEKSVRYLFDDVFSKFGFARVPLAAIGDSRSIPWRLVRRAIRMSLLWPLRTMSAAFGRGPVIEAAFRRNPGRRGREKA